MPSVLLSVMGIYLGLGLSTDVKSQAWLQMHVTPVL